MRKAQRRVYYSTIMIRYEEERNVTIKMRHTDRVSKRRGLGGVPGARANELGKNIRVRRRVKR